LCTLQSIFRWQVRKNFVSYVKQGEIKREIENLNEYKAPGFELITATILRQLPRKAIVLLTIIFNGMVRLSYFQLAWKFALIILIHKPGKPLNETSPYRPISLLPIPSKLCERLLLTIQQTHRIVHKIAASLEDRNLCTAVFLDVAQAFDKVWHADLLYKIKKVRTT
jgi:hypothetical protein